MNTAERDRLYLALATLAVERERENIEARDDYRDDSSSTAREIEARYRNAAQPEAIVREFLATHGTFACPVCGLDTPHSHSHPLALPATPAATPTEREIQIARVGIASGGCKRCARPLSTVHDYEAVAVLTAVSLTHPRPAVPATREAYTRADVIRVAEVVNAAKTPLPHSVLYAAVDSVLGNAPQPTEDWRDPYVRAALQAINGAMKAASRSGTDEWDEDHFAEGFTERLARIGPPLPHATAMRVAEAVRDALRPAAPQDARLLDLAAIVAEHVEPSEVERCERAVIDAAETWRPMNRHHTAYEWTAKDMIASAVDALRAARKGVGQ